MAVPITKSLRASSLFLKSTASFVVVAFLSLTLQPLALAANLPAPHKQPPRIESNDEKLEKTLEALEDKLEKLDSKLVRRQSTQREQDEVKSLHTELDTLHTEALREFDNIALHIKDKKLAAVINERHRAAVATYTAEMQKLKTNLAGVMSSKDDTERQVKVTQTKTHLKEKQKLSKHKRPKQSFDPNDLPSKPLTPNRARKLKLKKEEYTRAGLFDHPYAKLASHGTYRIDQLRVPPILPIAQRAMKSY